jgi:hypothetical protein
MEHRVKGRTRLSILRSSLLRRTGVPLGFAKDFAVAREERFSDFGFFNLPACLARPPRLLGWRAGLRESNGGQGLGIAELNGERKKGEQ